MSRINGIYAGNYIWASAFENNEFSDWIISSELPDGFNCEYITSDIASIQGKSSREKALAYYSYSLLTKIRNQQTHVFEIICDGYTAELFVYDGFEQKNANLLVHQKANMSGDESAVFLSSKFILEQFIDQYPENEAVRKAYGSLLDYEESVLYEEDDNPETLKLMNCIYSQIDLTAEDFVIELYGYRIQVKRDDYSNAVCEDVLDAYLPNIQTFVERINNNFNKEDILYLYIKNFARDGRLKNRVDKISEDNCIHIEIEPYEDRMISRGNAYLYYLQNQVLLDRIKENIGKFYISFEKNWKVLNTEHGELEFICDRDFDDRYRFEVSVPKSQRNITVDFFVPFSMNGSTIIIRYSYEAEGLHIVIEDKNSGERLQEIIRYSN